MYQHPMPPMVMPMMPPMSGPIPPQQYPMPTAPTMPVHPVTQARDLPNDKEQLGEYLYPLVEIKNPENAAKITGMLLEMEIDQIHKIIRDTTHLDKWIVEALKVFIVIYALGIEQIGAGTIIFTLTNNINNYREICMHIHHHVAE